MKLVGEGGILVILDKLCVSGANIQKRICNSDQKNIFFRPKGNLFQTKEKAFFVNIWVLIIFIRVVTISYIIFLLNNPTYT